MDGRCGPGVFAKGWWQRSFSSATHWCCYWCCCGFMQRVSCDCDSHLIQHGVVHGVLQHSVFVGCYGGDVDTAAQNLGV
jgi:hypothetical protein